MIVNNNQQGLSLLEVLIAVLMMSVVVLGLTNLQAVLISELDAAKKQLQGERIAFQLLEVYPDRITVDLPQGWDYQVINEQYTMACKRVKVIIQPNLGKQITQERLFCQ
ncbi:prepilin-type N-terminal cleavage/methylation domain-containing protein [Orbus mooreae]|uniref:prepilin-type N-terminal cleavage/methylation domain-containing protein n=1 Tax=Orbus mooreae TaxID=3074107 RepID=UPI00370D0827